MHHQTLSAVLSFFQREIPAFFMYASLPVVTGDSWSHHFGDGRVNPRGLVNSRSEGKRQASFGGVFRDFVAKRCVLKE